MPTIDTLLGEARRLLVASASPGLDARLLMQHVTGLDAAGLLVQGHDALAPDKALQFDALVQRRAAGEPVSRILGYREFYGRRFEVTPAVLDPRPDTEVLVDAVLARLPAFEPCRILDLGTGSGAIVISLLAERPHWRGEAVDISPDALAVAQSNADALGVGARLVPHEGVWFAPVTGRFAAIVSNPPYIPQADIAGLAVDVRAHDPHLALDGGEDGLACYQLIADGAQSYLAPGGLVVVEIGAGQSPDVVGIFAQAGFKHVESCADLGGIERVLVFAPGAETV